MNKLNHFLKFEIIRKPELIAPIIIILLAIFWLIYREDSFEPIIVIIGSLIAIIGFSNSKKINEIKQEARDREVPIESHEFDYYIRTFPKQHKGLKIALTFYKNTDFSWIYEEGISLIELLNNPKKSAADKNNAIDELLYILDKTYKEDIIIDKFKKRREFKIQFTKTYDTLKEYLKGVKGELEV